MFVEKVVGAVGITEVHYKPEDFATIYPLEQLKHEADQALALLSASEEASDGNV